VKELFVIQCDPNVPPGFLAEQLIGQGVSYRLLHAYDEESLPSSQEAAAVVVLGGAMGAGEDEKYPFLRQVKRLIRECVGGPASGRSSRHAGIVRKSW
jgi:GMP synthase (glutamine-hydrolysing)